MTLKQFRFLKIITAAIVAMAFSQSLIAGNYFIPILVLAVAFLVLFYAKKRVREVVADERDYEIGGKSAFLAIQIFSIIAVIITFVLYYSRASNIFYEPVAMTLSFSVIALMLLYSLLFNYDARFKLGDKRTFYLTLLVVIILAIFLGGLRFLSGEDSWLCENGQWLKHGQPNSPMPNTPCNL